MRTCSRYILTNIDCYGGKVSVEFEAENINNFMDYLRQFLLAAGFHPEIVSEATNQD